MSSITIHNADCLPAMREMPDDFFDLAIVDPPYGINIVRSMEKDKSSSSMFSHSWASYNANKNWDSEIPSSEYFEQLQRISKNQIIWGGNYFIENLSNTKCFLIWDKNNGTNPLADCELAWTSFNKPVRKFTMHHFESGYDTKIHPTQKPVALYTWLLDNYAKQGDRILDTHIGSGSIAIACHNMGFDLVGYELDEDYYNAALNRLHDHQQQLRLF